jgi:PIN domain nuclease of toxin-antitoxin system
MAEALLFDLQALLFWVNGSIPDAVLQSVEAGGKIYVSPLSLWEFILKETRHPFNIDYMDLLRTVEQLDGQILPIMRSHLNRVRLMAIVKNVRGKEHHDPFDRLLVAQALEEDFVLVGGDHMFPIYQKEMSLKVLWET